MMDHGSIPLDNNFDFKFYSGLNLQQQRILMVAGCKKSGKIA